MIYKYATYHLKLSVDLAYNATEIYLNEDDYSFFPEGYFAVLLIDSDTNNREKIWCSLAGDAETGYYLSIDERGIPVTAYDFPVYTTDVIFQFLPDDLDTIRVPNTKDDFYTTLALPLSDAETGTLTLTDTSFLVNPYNDFYISIYEGALSEEIYVYGFNDDPELVINARGVSPQSFTTSATVKYSSYPHVDTEHELSLTQAFNIGDSYFYLNDISDIHPYYFSMTITEGNNEDTVYCYINDIATKEIGYEPAITSNYTTAATVSFTEINLTEYRDSVYTNRRPIITNNARSTLATALTATDTTLTMASGNNFPSPSSDECFWVFVKEGAKTEWILCGTRTDATLAIINRDNPKSFYAGATVSCYMNEEFLKAYAQTGTKELDYIPHQIDYSDYLGDEIFYTTASQFYKYLGNFNWRKLNWDLW